MLVHGLRVDDGLLSLFICNQLKINGKTKLAGFLQSLLQLIPAACPSTGHGIGAQPES
jgi:hypothetical protein